MVGVRKHVPIGNFSSLKVRTVSCQQGEALRWLAEGVTSCSLVEVKQDPHRYRGIEIAWYLLTIEGKMPHQLLHRA